MIAFALPLVQLYEHKLRLKAVVQHAEFNNPLVEQEGHSLLAYHFHHGTTLCLKTNAFRSASAKAVTKSRRLQSGRSERKEAKKRTVFSKTTRVAGVELNYFYIYAQI